MLFASFKNVEPLRPVARQLTISQSTVARVAKNVDKLHSFIANFHLPQKDIYPQSIETFQQDEARPHLTQAVFHTLTPHFPIIISQKNSLSSTF